MSGAVYTFIFTQDATGGRTLTFDTNYIFPAVVSSPTLSASSGATDSAQFVSDGTYLYYISGFATAAAPCVAPTNLSVAVTINTSNVTTNLSWTNNSSNLQSNLIQRSSDGVTNWISTGTVSAGSTSTSFVDSDLSTYAYHWRVAANCGLAGTNFSLARQGASSIPGPTSVKRTPINSTSATISWGAASGATGYEISRSIVGVGLWTVIATPSAGSTSYTDSNLALNAAYSYRVRAVQGSNYSGYYDALTECGTPAQFTCGTTGNDCYSNPNAVLGASAVTPGGRCLTMIYANGSSGFTVWKDQYSNNILSPNGLDSWSMALNLNGKGQTTTPFNDGNLGTSSTVIAGRSCPTNVYISDTNKISTGNCLYYTPIYGAQTLNAAGNDSGAELGFGGTSSRVWYFGNIATCSSKKMRLPTLFETASSDPGGSNKPTDVTPTAFSSATGVPSGSGNTWTASAYSGGTYWTWSSNTAGGNGLVGDYGVWSSLIVRCVLP